MNVDVPSPELAPSRSQACDVNSMSRSVRRESNLGDDPEWLSVRGRILKAGVKVWYAVNAGSTSSQSPSLSSSKSSALLSCDRCECCEPNKGQQINHCMHSQLLPSQKHIPHSTRATPLVCAPHHACSHITRGEPSHYSPALKAHTTSTLSSHPQSSSYLSSRTLLRRRFSHDLVSHAAYLLEETFL